MGRKHKKGQHGTATEFISRTKAVRKLQLSLVDFRRLCILKGVYPREPQSKKKLSGSTANRTYYFVKDIKYLAHEPLIEKFREMKIFSRKLKKALAKEQDGVAEVLRDKEPKINVDHIIRERYPSVVDAVRDLDDCLCLVFLFANFPQIKFIQSSIVAKCKRYSQEFLYALVKMRALRKVFLSIKGIYYQAELMGQTVTWIAPYKFSSDVPPEVDFRVMSTFLIFYSRVLGFVNWRLFADLGLKYPPQIDEEMLRQDAGMSSLTFEPISFNGDEKTAAQKSKKAKTKKGKSSEDSSETLSSIAAEKAEEEAATAAMDEFPEQMDGGEESIPNLEELKKEQKETAAFTKLFDGCWFFLSREVPRYSLEFVIKAFGGNVSWEAFGDMGGGPFGVDDQRITHHIVDRTKPTSHFDGRIYVQPQWVYDSVNARTLLPSHGYAVGAVLPPHLSPFVKETDEDYMPPERVSQIKAASRIHQADVEAEEEDEDTVAGGDADADEEDDEEDIADGDDETAHLRELQEELAGEDKDVADEVKSDEAKKKQGKKTKRRPGVDGLTKKQIQALKEKEAALAEREELSQMIMSKKRRHLYQKIQKTRERKQKKVEELRAKRRAHDREVKQKEKSNKKAKKTAA